MDEEIAAKILAGADSVFIRVEETVLLIFGTD